MLKLFLLFALPWAVSFCCMGQTSHTVDGYFYLIIQKSVNESGDHYSETVSSQFFYTDSLNEKDFSQRFLYDGIHILKPEYKRISNRAVYKSGIISLGNDTLFDLVAHAGLYADFMQSKKGIWAVLFQGKAPVQADSCHQYHGHKQLGLECISLAQIPTWTYLGYRNPVWTVSFP